MTVQEHDPTGAALPTLRVVGAAIERDGLILCTRRGTGRLAGLWEFPGGKIERGESTADAIRREIAEELGCRIVVGAEVATTTWAYDHATITLTTLRCALEPGEEPRLTEHTAARWMAPADLDELEWAPADVEAVERLRDAVAQVTAGEASLPPR